MYVISDIHLLGKYVREEKVITLQEAVRRMTGLPATNLGLNHCGFDIGHRGV
jgi:N-acyl-D-amino-acid deacylase